MLRSIITTIVLGLLPGCAAIQVPHRSPSPGSQAGLPIGLAEIMHDSSGIFDSFTNSDDIANQPVEVVLFRLKLSLAAADPITTIDKIAAIASVNGGSVIDSDTSRLDLRVPTGSLKSVLAAIATLGDITKFAPAVEEPVGDTISGGRKLNEVLRYGDFVVHMLSGAKQLFSFGWMEDGAARQMDMIRKRMQLTPEQSHYTGVDISLVALQPQRPGISDYMLFFVRGVGDLLKR